MKLMSRVAKRSEMYPSIVRESLKMSRVYKNAAFITMLRRPSVMIIKGVRRNLIIGFIKVFIAVKIMEVISSSSKFPTKVKFVIR
tara:strand:- start:892 stop:1146 length:255 start_codon:yes stop_codon:yes gene_type:complete